MLEANEFERGQLLKIEQSIDIQSNFQQAVEQVRSLMFVERFALEIESRADLLGQ